MRATTALVALVLLVSVQFFGTYARLSHGSHKISSRHRSKSIAPPRFRRQAPNDSPAGGVDDNPSPNPAPTHPPDWRDPAIMTDSQQAFLTALQGFEARHTDAQPVEIAFGLCLKFWPASTTKVGGQLWKEDGTPGEGTKKAGVYLVPEYLGAKDKGPAIRDDLHDDELDALRNTGVIDATGRPSGTTHSFAAIVAIEGRSRFLD